MLLLRSVAGGGGGLVRSRLSLTVWTALVRSEAGEVDELLETRQRRVSVVMVGLRMRLRRRCRTGLRLLGRLLGLRLRWLSLRGRLRVATPKVEDVGEEVSETTAGSRVALRGTASAHTGGGRAQRERLPEGAGTRSRLGRLGLGLRMRLRLGCRLRRRLVGVLGRSLVRLRRWTIEDQLLELLAIHADDAWLRDGGRPSRC